MASSQPVIVVVTAQAPPKGMHPGLLGFITARRALPGCLQKGPASGATQRTPRHNVILLEDDLPEADPLPALHSTWAGLPGTPLPFLRFSIATHFAECGTVDNGRSCVDIMSCRGRSNFTVHGPVSLVSTTRAHQRHPVQARVPPTQPLPVIHARSRPNATELERQRALQKKVGCSFQP